MKCLLLATAMFLSSSSLFAREELKHLVKKDQLHFIQSIGEVAPALNIEAYERELLYIEQGLSLEEKVRNEANRIAESIRTQVIKSYEVELEEKNNSYEAYEAVRSMIFKDLELADDEMREDLLKIAEHALQTILEAPRSESLELSQLENVLREDIKKRESFLLNMEVQSSFSGVKKISLNEFKNYSSKAELVRDLITLEDNARWFRSSNVSFKSGEATSNETSISLQVKIEFLGVSVEAGPRITFKREFKTNVTVLADGLAPALRDGGLFDYFEKDNFGRPTKNRRFIGFYCDANLSFRTDYNGKGSFKLAGIGAESSASKEYSNLVSLTSRRIHVPEYVSNKRVDIRMLSEICHKDFLNAKINSKVRVKDSLDVMMRNVISGLRFTHPDTKCVVDSHCNKWFNTEVISIMRNKATARCLGNNSGSYSCVLRGTRGQACAVYENGKRTSGGLGEYICDRGLKCVKTRNAGWLQGGRLYQPAFGECR